MAPLSNWRNCLIVSYSHCLFSVNAPIDWSTQKLYIKTLKQSKKKKNVQVIFMKEYRSFEQVYGGSKYTSS